jgi:coenzyme PQQ precursor peptide PqqA
LPERTPCRCNLAADLRRMIMAWNKPKIVEVPVSMEINMYFCATRK